MKKIIRTLQIAAAYIGTVVGAGFASGREIIQFFTQYQAWGTFGVLLSSLLMAWMSTKLMIYSRRIDAYSFNELFVHLFGTRLGTVIEALMFFIIFGLTGVMLAGSGAVFHEHLLGGRQLGMLLTLLISFFFLIKGVRGLFWINSLVVPILIAFVSLAFMLNTHAPLLQLPQGLEVKGLLSAIRYAAFNMLTALVVLVPLAREAPDEKTLRWGGWIGGAGLGILMLMAHLLLLGHPRVLTFEMPMAELARPIGLVMHFGFALVIFGEILTTFVGNIFGLARQLHSTFPLILSSGQAMILLIIAAYALGQAGYASLISTLYPLYGTLCSLIFIYLCFVRLPNDHSFHG
ncbi:MAG: transporter [Sporolactobacillus sp.]